MADAAIAGVLFVIVLLMLGVIDCPAPKSKRPPPPPSPVRPPETGTERRAEEIAELRRRFPTRLI